MVLSNITYGREVSFPAITADERGNDFHKAPCASSLTPVLAAIEFLFPYLDRLHTVVLVGSAVHGTHTEGSDFDLVVIAKENYLETICEAVFEKDIEMTLALDEETNLEVTVLEESQVEELFSLASPFAFAIRYGAVLFDDSYLATILSKPNPNVPIRKYYTKSLFENVAYQYFSTIKQIEKEVKQNNCTPSCCNADNSSCTLLPTAMLPKLIFRMLYLTLPGRGLMPLSKDDAMVFAETFYSPEVANAVKKAATLIRKKNDVMPLTVYRSLKLASVKLFRETLTILGYQDDVRQIIQDAANSVRGNFDGIENSLLKRCFV